MSCLVRVSKDRFEQFIKNYPRELAVDVCGISEPPVITYNDFSDNRKWPDSIVARTWAYDDDPKGYYYEPPEERVYQILDEVEE